jgi:hypothetical protein
MHGFFVTTPYNRAANASLARTRTASKSRALGAVPDALAGSGGVLAQRVSQSQSARSCPASRDKQEQGQQSATITRKLALLKGRRLDRESEKEASIPTDRRGQTHHHESVDHYHADVSRFANAA